MSAASCPARRISGRRRLRVGCRRLERVVRGRGGRPAAAVPGRSAWPRRGCGRGLARLRAAPLGLRLGGRGCRGTRRGRGLSARLGLAARLAASLRSRSSASRWPSPRPRARLLFGRPCGRPPPLHGTPDARRPRRRSADDQLARRGWRRRCRGSGSRPRPGRSWCRPSPTIGIPQRRASATAICSVFRSTMKTASGSRSMSRDAAEVAGSASRARLDARCALSSAALERAVLGRTSRASCRRSIRPSRSSGSW